nr:unnamed protein product [Callosobruchus analis]
METESISDMPDLYSLGFCEIPPWKLRTPRVDLQCQEYSRKSTSPSSLKTAFYRLINGYPGAIQIYTDGSKTEQGIGSAFYIADTAYSWSLPPQIADAFPGTNLASQNTLLTSLTAINPAPIFMTHLRLKTEMDSPYCRSGATMQKIYEYNPCSFWYSLRQ